MTSFKAYDSLTVSNAGIPHIYITVVDDNDNDDDEDHRYECVAGDESFKVMVKSSPAAATASAVYTKLHPQKPQCQHESIAAAVNKHQFKYSYEGQNNGDKNYQHLTGKVRRYS